MNEWMNDGGMWVTYWLSPVPDAVKHHKHSNDTKKKSKNGYNQISSSLWISIFLPICSWQDPTKFTQKLLLSTLNNNESVSASMSTRGKDNALSHSTKCFCSSKRPPTWHALHLDTKHCTGACLRQWLATWHLYNSMAAILFGRARERNAECQSGPTVLVGHIRVLCWNN